MPSPNVVFLTSTSPANQSGSDVVPLYLSGSITGLNLLRRFGLVHVVRDTLNSPYLAWDALTVRVGPHA